MKKNKILFLFMLLSATYAVAQSEALTFTYSSLLDHKGNTLQQWNTISNSYSAHLTDSGTVWYTGGSGGGIWGGGWSGGGGGSTCAVMGGSYSNIYEIDWNGNNIRTITADDLGGGNPHHAITLTEKGTVLAIVSESYNGACGERIVEYDVANKKVIWSWHTNDHQGSGPTKLQPNTTKPEPYHMNQIDWDPVSNKIAFSAHYTYEIYVIDRSIDSTQAKGTAGDILWRFGNPRQYGASGVQYATEAIHSSRWVKSGVTGAGNLVLYANQSPNNNNFATGYEVKPIFNLRSSGEWDYEIVFQGSNNNSRHANSGAMEKIFNGNWLISFTNEGNGMGGVTAYEFAADGGAKQSTSNALGSWKANASNGIHRYPICYGAILAAKNQGDAKATEHYNNYCLNQPSSSSAALPISSSSAESTTQNSSSSVWVNPWLAGSSSSVWVNPWLTDSTSAVSGLINAPSNFKIQIKDKKIAVYGIKHFANIEVFNLHGIKKHSGEISSVNHLLSVESLKPGLYIVNVRNNGKIFSKTIRIGD